MTHTYVRSAARVAGVLIAGVAALQLSLALGLPMGDATFGGAAPTVNGVLSPAFRVIATINAIILLLFAWVILARAGLWTSQFLSDRFLFWAAWGIVGFLTLNTVGNLSASHPFERYVMGTVTLVLIILCGYVALRAPRPEKRS